jgi:DNA-binding transcriptional MerR regulator
MSQFEDFIPTPVRCAVLQRLKLLRRLQEVDLSPDEAWALLDRVKTHTSSADDRERLAHLIRVTTAVTDQLRAAPAEPEPPAPQRLLSERQAKRKRQAAEAARRRQRR